MRVLVPLDGSDLSEKAIPWGKLLAKGPSSSLVLLRAVSPHMSAGNLLEAFNAAERYLDEKVSQLRDASLKVEATVHIGEPVEVIVRASILEGVDLIVMTTHGRSGVSRFLYGSVAEGVLARSQSPVMLVRGWTDESMAATEVDTILVPLDGTEFAEAALSLAKEIAGMLRAKLVLFRVASARAQQGAILAETTPDTFRYSEDPEEVARLEAESYLQRVASDCVRHGVDAETDVAFGDPGREICRAERGHRAGLVVMTTHGRTGLERLVLGSVATEVLRCGVAPLVLLSRRP